MIVRKQKLVDYSARSQLHRGGGPVGITPLQGRAVDTVFDYPQKLPFDLKEVAVEVRGGAQIRDISYADPDGERVSAYLVASRQKGSFAGLIFLHGGEQDRSIFLKEALYLAELGVVSLLIDEPSAREMPLFEEPETDCKRYVRTILKLRRGLDLLLSLQDVDPKRIGYVGLSFGAWMGGVLSGIEDRVKTYILIAGIPSMTDFWRTHNHPIIQRVRESLAAEQLESYLRLAAPLDAIHFVRRASPASLFFQFARHDEIVLETAASWYARAASEPKRVAWYDAHHHDVFVNQNALRDRIEWLQNELI